MPQPYKIDRITRKSITREYVEHFLERAADTNDDGQPILESLYTGRDSLVQLQDNIYPSKSKDSTKRYVGRAARIPSAVNPHEETWCVKIDIANACRKLDRRSRHMMYYRYIVGLEDIEISALFNVTDRAVRYIIGNALTRIAKILDRET